MPPSASSSSTSASTSISQKANDEEQRQHQSVTLDFPDIGLRYTWRVAELPWSVFQALGIGADSRVTELDVGCVEVLRPFVDAVVEPSSSSLSALSEDEGEKKGDAAKKIAVHKSAASAFLYLYLSLCCTASHPLSFPSSSSSTTISTPALLLPQHTTYTLRSTIPIGAGLGSSASISVCLATALLQQTNSIPQDPWPSLNPTLRSRTAETINNWAFVGELCIHGTPSGIDNTVSTRGKAVKFRRRQAPLGPEVELLEKWPALPLLLVDTKRSRSTAVEVAKVKRLKEAYPAVTEHVLDAIDSVTESVHECTSRSGGLGGGEAGLELEKLGGLIRLNHELLSTLGVSHPDLEVVRGIVDGAGVGWTKLTGAGGGGCAFSILNPKATAKDLQVVVAGLEAAGCERYETVLGGHGVGFLAEVGAARVDQFRKLESAKQIEDFIGIGKVVKDGHDGWQFLD